MTLFCGNLIEGGNYFLAFRTNFSYPGLGIRLCIVNVKKYHFQVFQTFCLQQLLEVEKGDLSHMDKGDMFEDSDDDSAVKLPKKEYYDKYGEKKYRGIEGGESEEEEEEMEEEPMFNEDSE